MPVTKEHYANIKNYKKILKSDGSEVKNLYNKFTYNFVNIIFVFLCKIKYLY